MVWRFALGGTPGPCLMRQPQDSSLRKRGNSMNLGWMVLAFHVEALWHSLVESAMNIHGVIQIRVLRRISKRKPWQLNLHPTDFKSMNQKSMVSTVSQMFSLSQVGRFRRRCSPVCSPALNLNLHPAGDPEIPFRYATHPQFLQHFFPSRAPFASRITMGRSARERQPDRPT